MKYWEHTIDNNLSFENVKRQIKEYYPYYATRPCWDGVHFYSKQGQYCILLKDGTVMIDALDKVYSKDENDWMIVIITDEAVKILEDNNLLEYIHRYDYHGLKICPYNKECCPLKLDWNWCVEDCDTCERKLERRNN